MLSWDSLKFFYHVASEGSISVAADKLAMSQPSLSRIIINLEERLDKKLFLRLRSGLELTHEGEILFKHVRDMNLELMHAEHILEDDALNVSGDLIIGTTPALATSWLMKFIPLFLEKHPDVCLKIIHESETGPKSLADVHIRPCAVIDPTLIHKYLLKFTMGLYASQSYIDQYGMPQSPEDLDNHKLISYSDDSPSPTDNINWLLKVGNRTNSLREPSLKLNSAEYLLSAASRGLGIVELGKGFPEREGLNLIEILPDLAGPSVEVFFIYPEYKRNSRKINALWEHIQDMSGSKATEKSMDDFSSIKLARIG